MRHLILISSLTLYSISLLGQEVFTKDNVAIRGYDPVAYFSESKPVLGNDQYTFVWNDAVWKFSNQKHLDMFKSDPENILRSLVATAPTEWVMAMDTKQQLLRMHGQS